MFIKRLTIIISLLLICFFSTTAQEREDPQPPTGNASNIYVEFGGPGVIYSINYDGRFGKTDRGLGFRIGAGGLYADGEGYFQIPFGLNYLLGSNGNYFEIGAGASVGSMSDAFSSDSFNDVGTMGYMCFGYRKQAFRRKGVIFRASFTPLFGKRFFCSFRRSGGGV